MATRSGTEFRAGTGTHGTTEDIPEWAKSLLKNQEESRVQIEFLMTQLIELKVEAATEKATAVPVDSTTARAIEVHEEDPHWIAAKRGAKPEVTTFDGSLDPKKYMDWEVGLEEYFDWYQLPEGRRLQFAQMKLSGQAWIYWRNLQATAKRRREATITTWAEMKGRLQGKFVPDCYRPMIIDEWQHLQQGDSTVAEYIAKFDDLMIRCNVEEEPVAMLARFRAGLRPEFQRELILREVTTLEKAYRYAANMELYTNHAQRDNAGWNILPEMTSTDSPSSASKITRYPSHPTPRTGAPATYSLPLPSTLPQRPLLPAVPIVMPNPGTNGYGNRGGISTGLQPASQVAYASHVHGRTATRRPDDGQPSSTTTSHPAEHNQFAHSLLQVLGMGALRLSVPFPEASHATGSGLTSRDPRRRTYSAPGRH